MVKKFSDLSNRYQIEQEKFDRIAHGQHDGNDLVVPQGVDFHSAARKDTYLPWVSEFLGELEGRKVLEVGCGTGELTVLFALSGALVSAFDISPKSIEVTRNRCTINGVSDRVDLRVAVGEELPYESEAFDIVFGKSILHHLDVNLAGPELYRVLKTGGKATFSEPLANNYVIEFIRDYMPYARKSERGTDIPLKYADLEAWGKPYKQFSYKEFYFLGALDRAVGWRWEFWPLHRLDRVLLRRFKFLRPFATYCIMFMEK